VRHRLKLLALAALWPLVARAGEIIRDDPEARLRATREWRGESLAGRASLLSEAARERDRYAIGVRSRASPVLRSAAPVQAGAFVNIGPASADFEDNGGRYTEMDSGRARQIVTDPVNPAVV